MSEPLEQGIERIEQQLFDMVDTASDHELFVSGYLHGHFSLVVSEAQQKEEQSMQDVDKRMRMSLDRAFANGELAEGDQADVRSLWQRLYATR